MEKKIIAAGMMACMLGAGANAQTENANAPKGEAIVQVFTNFHTGFGDNNHKRGFDLDRSYLGYQYHLGNGLTVKGVMDESGVLGMDAQISGYDFSYPLTGTIPEINTLGVSDELSI